MGEIGPYYSVEEDRLGGAGLKGCFWFFGMFLFVVLVCYLVVQHVT